MTTTIHLNARQTNDILTCPISLEHMKDPVYLRCTDPTQVTPDNLYDKASICQSLLVQPALDPLSNCKYTAPLCLVPCRPLRFILQCCGRYTEYEDPDFAEAYLTAWTAYARRHNLRQQQQPQQLQRARMELVQERQRARAQARQHEQQLERLQGQLRQAELHAVRLDRQYNDARRAVQERDRHRAVNNINQTLLGRLAAVVQGGQFALWILLTGLVLAYFCRFLSKQVVSTTSITTTWETKDNNLASASSEALILMLPRQAYTYERWFYNFQDNVQVSLLWWHTIFSIGGTTLFAATGLAGVFFLVSYLSKVVIPTIPPVNRRRMWKGFLTGLDWTVTTIILLAMLEIISYFWFRIRFRLIPQWGEIHDSFTAMAVEGTWNGLVYLAQTVSLILGYVVTSCRYFLATLSVLAWHFLSGTWYGIKFMGIHLSHFVIGSAHCGKWVAQNLAYGTWYFASHACQGVWYLIRLVIGSAIETIQLCVQIIAYCTKTATGCLSFITS